MQTIGVMVTLRIPDSMTPEKACEEVATSVGFGTPKVSLQWMLPDEATGE